MSEDQATQSRADVLRQAESLVQERQFQRALATLAEADLAGNPGASYTAGLALLGLQRSAEGASALRKSADLFDAAGQPGPAGEAWERIAEHHALRRQFREALEPYRHALQRYKVAALPLAMARVHRSMGSVHLDLGDHVSARSRFTESGKLCQEAGDLEGMVQSVVSVASLAFDVRGRGQAVAEYRRSVDQDGCEHHVLLNNLGFLLLLEGDLEGARTYLQRAERDALSRDARSDDAGLLELNLGIADLLQKQPVEAEPHLRRALEHFGREGPGRAVELVVLANHAWASHGCEATMLTEDGLKEAVARLNLAVALVGQDRLDEALSEATQARDLDVEMAYTHAGLGWIYMVRGDSTAATGVFRRAFAKAPNDVQVRLALEIINPHLTARVGRNDPCPCGSGAKFKKCHGVA